MIHSIFEFTLIILYIIMLKFQQECSMSLVAIPLKCKLIFHSHQTNSYFYKKNNTKLILILLTNRPPHFFQSIITNCHYCQLEARRIWFVWTMNVKSWEKNRFIYRIIHVIGTFFFFWWHHVFNFLASSSVCNITLALGY